jgi:SAM-dependent methyltransferase
VTREHEAHAHHGAHSLTSSEQWGAAWAEHGPHTWRPGPDALLPPEVEGLAPGRSLDIGCGDGNNAIWLAEQGWRATGIDFADSAVQRARRHAAQQGVEVEFTVADAASYDPAEAFDLVTFFYVHPPAEVLPRILQRAAGLLAPGGVLIFVGHDRSNPDFHAGHLDPAELNTVSEVVAALPALEVERAAIVEHEIELGDARLPAVSTFVRVRRPASP